MTSSSDDRVILITGGAHGIGRAIAERCLDAGARVCAVGRDQARLDAFQAERGGDGRLLCLRADIGDEAQVRAAFADCRARLGPVEVLINNAGLGIPTPDLASAGAEAVDRQFAVNARGVFLCAREALADMKPAGRGHIITVVSAAGTRSNPTAPLYCASKFAAKGLSSGIADQVLPLGIKVTDINPGPVDSDYWGGRTVPREKFLKIADVAEAVAWVLRAPPHVLVRTIDFESILTFRK